MRVHRVDGPRPAVVDFVVPALMSTLRSINAFLDSEVISCVSEPPQPFRKAIARQSDEVDPRRKRRMLA